MDKEKRFKLGIPRIFKSSCSSRFFSTTVLVGSLPPIPHSNISTKSTSFSSICKSKDETQQDKAIKCKATGDVDATSKLNTLAPFYFDEAAASSPVSSLILDREFYHNPISKQKKKKSGSTRVFRSSSRRLEVPPVFKSYCCSSNDEEEVFFSSRSRSSDSSGQSVEYEMSLIEMKDSIAVMRSSSDPYEDFRMSMVEMIVEKQILSRKGLEMLLERFLALNSRHHHKVILQVFMEIWEALFSHSR